MRSHLQLRHSVPIAAHRNKPTGNNELVNINKDGLMNKNPSNLHIFCEYLFCGYIAKSNLGL